MRLITFQHKSVYETLDKDGIYKCTFCSDWNKESPKCYSILSKRLNLKDKIYPIFAWANIIGLPLVVNIETLTRALEMVSFGTKNNNDYYVFELEVPDELVDIQDFYEFSSAKYEEETEYREPKARMFITDYGDYGVELQATIPYIKAEWIKGVYSLVVEQFSSIIHIKDLHRKELPFSERSRIAPTKMDIF